MGKLYRAISADGSAFAEVLDAKDIVSEIERIHKTSAVVTAGLGRLSIAASLMNNAPLHIPSSFTCHPLLRNDCSMPL